MLEAQVEELAPRVGEALLELRNVQLAHFCDLHLLPPYPREEAGLYGELLGGEAHGLPRELLVDAAHLEHHAPRLDHGDVPLDGALAATHAGLGRLLGYGLVGEDVDPDLPPALDLPRHRDTGRLYLAVAYPGRLQSLQPVLAELHVGAALGLAPHLAPVGPPALELLRFTHP